VVPDPRFLGRIEELVENRNAISHGRRTAEDVGRQYSTPELEARIDDVGSIATYLIDTMQQHTDGGACIDSWLGSAGTAADVSPAMAPIRAAAQQDIGRTK
jgi:hypothetical protein